MRIRSRLFRTVRAGWLGGLALAGVLAAGGAECATVATVFSFPGGAGGAIPQGQRPLGPLAAAPDGSLFGVAQSGGPANSGVIFQLAPASADSTTLTGSDLHDFAGDTPVGAIVRDNAGNLYGMALSHLNHPQDDPGCYFDLYCNWVYRLAPPATEGGSWSYSILHKFQHFPNSFGPSMDLAITPSGAIAGASSTGGDPACQCGFVFQLTPPPTAGAAWGYSVTYTFKALPDAEDPASGLALDAAGNLVGVTLRGGGGGCIAAPGGAAIGCGAVYRVTPAGQDAVLHGFSASEQGQPIGRLAVGGDGTLYGVASYDVFSLAPPKSAGKPWVKQTLYELPLPQPGDVPYPFALPAGVILDPAGNLFGVNQRATTGSPPASAFELVRPLHLTAKWHRTVLATFKSNELLSGLVRSGTATLYGIVAGGAAGGGQVYAISLP